MQIQVHHQRPRILAIDLQLTHCLNAAALNVEHLEVDHSMQQLEIYFGRLFYMLQAACDWLSRLLAAFYFLESACPPLEPCLANALLL